MELIKKINLEVDREYYTPITTRQSDSARSLEFSITSNGLQIDLTDVSVKLVAIKPDNTKIYNDLTISNNIAKLELTTQLLAVVGKVKCQLQLIKSTDILRTIVFYIDVKESLDVTGAVESKDEFTTLENAISTLNEWNTYFEQTSGKIETKYTARLTTAENNITALQNTVSTNTTNIENNTTNIEDLTETVNNLIISGTEGTTEGWNWQKYSDGTLILRRKATTSSLTLSKNSTTNTYLGTITFQFPSAVTLLTTPHVNVDCECSKIIHTQLGSNPNTSSFILRIECSYTGDITDLVAHITVYSTWK